jgi:alkaline phosphatase
LTPARRAGTAIGAALVGVFIGFAAAQKPYLGGRERLPIRASGKITKVPAGQAGQPVPPAPPVLAEGPVRNVVLLVGDGMGFAQIAAGRMAALGPDGRLVLERFPAVGVVATHPDGGLVTKSDAAATALASGLKTRNGQIGTDPAGRSVATVLEVLRDAGWATGILTTSCLTDATPAAFAAHVASRRDEAGIAAQLSRAGVDLLAGGASSCSLPRTRVWTERGDGRDLVAEMRHRGVEVVTDAAGLQGAASLPLAALFEIEPQRSAQSSPSLEAMTDKALALLSASGRPFFVVLEEEEIDTAAHANDGARMSAALLRFDAAVGRAVEFAARDGATLVVVVADHATGGLSIDARSAPSELALHWGSSEHTGEPVPVFAYGPPSAAARFAGMHDNTEIPRRVAAALGVEFPPPAAAPAAGMAK